MNAHNLTPTLHASLIEKIFSRLLVTYGQEFASFFCTGVVYGADRGMENAQITWGETLAEFNDRPDAIVYALDHLPERVPNGIVFKSLCKAAPLVGCN
jgi:hypothetical protein